MQSPAVEEKMWKVALLAEGVDRNYVDEDTHTFEDKSPSSRRAWIEINSDTV